MAEYGVTFSKGFSLHDALAMIEDDDIQADTITLFPPSNACGDITDEDSGEEDNIDINNLPASQMQSECEVSSKHQYDFDWDSDDEIPLSQMKKNLKDMSTNQENQTSKEKKKKKKVYNYVKEDIPSNNDIFEKPQIDNVTEYTPSQLFSLFFDETIIGKITEETNRYASQKNRSLRVEISEVKCFIGVLLLSGYVPLPRRRMFWERAQDTNSTLVSQAISRNKFEHILSNIHFDNNDTLDQLDKFAKVRPLFTHLKEKFLEYAYTEENHSIDEAMVPYTGRHGCKQYIHGKPIRYGFKLWVGTTRQGYINWFEPYQGAATNISKIYNELGVGTSVVLEYADTIQSKWKDLKFHLYFDNFFTSIALLEHLTQKKLYGSGTMRENRIPSSSLRDSKVLKKTPRGTYDYNKISDQNIVFVKWNDNNIVTFASNAVGVNPLHSVRRYSQKEKKFIQVDQPHVVKMYNNSMGGVDRSDQNISLYRTSVRGKKWYFPLVTHCVDMAVNNAWQLHRNSGGVMDQLYFRRIIANTLLTQNKKDCLYQRGHCSQNMGLELRFDRMDHLVIPQEKQTRCGSCHKKVPLGVKSVILVCMLNVL